MNNKYIAKALFCCLLFLAVGCTDDFEEINTNTNLPVNINPGALLLSAAFNLAGDLHLYDWNPGTVINHYNETIQGSETAVYLWDNGTGAGIWNNSYETLTDVVDMQNLAEDLGDNSYAAIALVYRSFIFSILTNSFGDVPFSQAIQALNDDKDFTKFFPAYDQQSEIYPQLLADLRRANDLLDAGGSLLYGGDALYSGDLLKWKKFANSLRLRILTDISNTSYDVRSEMQEIVDNPDRFPIFTSNDDNATYRFGGISPDINGIDGYRDWDFNGRKPSAYFLDTLLESFDDPRIPLWFQPTPATANAEVKVYDGLPHGLIEAEATKFAESNLSRMNEEYFRQKTTPAIFMTYSEVQFILAEAAQRGWITSSETVESFYNAGILASMEQWGADATGYLERDGVPFDGDVNTILQQKYIAMYFTVGLQGWTQYRRTGQPQFPIGPGNANGGRIANRFLYPSIEQTLNGENYNAAISRIGGDDINIKHWWQN